MDSDDEYHNIDKFDRAAKEKKFDSDESDKDEKERARMNKKLKNKQKQQKNKKDDIDINAFIAGGDAGKEESKAEAGDDDKKKNKKMSKKEKRKAKKLKQKQMQEQEAEGDDEHHEEKEQDNEHEAKEDEEEKKGSEDALGYPVSVYYCPKCTVPPEFCPFVSTDLDTCKEDLQAENPSLYGQIYEGREEETKLEAKGKKKKNKNLKKNKEITKSTQVKVVKYKRGGKKMVTEISGLDGFGLNLKDFSKKLGKKFACGNSLIKDENTGESLVQLLGDVDEDDFMHAITVDFPDIAIAKFKFEMGGNKKGRKKK